MWFVKIRVFLCCSTELTLLNIRFLIQSVISKFTEGTDKFRRDTGWLTCQFLMYDIIPLTRLLNILALNHSLVYISIRHSFTCSLDHGSKASRRGG